jgi:hypothetical protein
MSSLACRILRSTSTPEFFLDNTLGNWVIAGLAPPVGGADTMGPPIAFLLRSTLSHSSPAISYLVDDHVIFR